MSLLMFLQTQDQVAIVTDTLATTLDGEPHLFQSKCWPLPHMRAVMAGTGVATLHERWYRLLQTRMRARDVDMLDLHTPVALRQLWQELLDEHPNVTATVTVYHFGVPEGQDRVVRYTYRSERNFESERSDEPGFGVKPVSTFNFEAPSALDDLIDLACRVRKEQDDSPADSRIYIGGELHMTTLDGGGSASITIHRFDGYDEMWEAMNGRPRRAADPSALSGEQS